MCNAIVDQPKLPGIFTTMMELDRVSIVIPFYNGDQYIDTCLNSLSAGSCAAAEKIIVNNSSEATSVHDIAAHYSNVTVIDTKPRIGFGRACNEGARIGINRGCRYIIFLNQDSIAHQDLVSEMIILLIQSRVFL
jgi:GT2 family glycosyltransferase